MSRPPLAERARTALASAGRAASEITPLRWVGIAACLAAIVGVLAWSADSWARAIEYWRLTSIIVVALAILAASRVGQGYAAHRRARERIARALRDAPTALLAAELVSACGDAPLLSVERAIREGVEEGWIRVLSDAGGAMTYAWVGG